MWQRWWDRAFTNTSRGRGLGAKRPKPSTAARFWVCCVKREWRVMGRGVGVGWMRWNRWWNRAFANASWGMGLGAKNPKLSAAAQFWVFRVKWEWRAMGEGVGVGWMRWQQWWGPAFANASWGMGLGANSPKPSAVAWFWVCRVKREWRAMGGRCWGGVDEVAVVVGSCVRKREPGEGAWG
jgi:hypothetical protein